MNARNVQADLVAVRAEASARLRPHAQTANGPDGPWGKGGGPALSISVAAAAGFAEVDRRAWQRWEKRGELPRAVLERFWRRVDEAAAKARD